MTIRRFTAIQCNCSICSKKGFLHLIVDPDDFEPISGEDHIREYRFNTNEAVHKFCPTCGIHPYYKPRSHPGSVDVNVRCIDLPLERFVIEPFDGKNWEQNVESIK